jgi:hypothetical protein
MDLSGFIPRLISMILSWMDASNLRNKLYEKTDQLNLAKVALDDIARMNDIKLMKDVAKRTLAKLP